MKILKIDYCLMFSISFVYGHLSMSYDDWSGLIFPKIYQHYHTTKYIFSRIFKAHKIRNADSMWIENSVLFFYFQLSLFFSWIEKKTNGHFSLSTWKFAWDGDVQHMVVFVDAGHWSAPACQMYAARMNEWMTKTMKRSEDHFENIIRLGRFVYFCTCSWQLAKLYSSVHDSIQIKRAKTAKICVKCS